MEFVNQSTSLKLIGLKKCCHNDMYRKMADWAFKLFIKNPSS